MEGRSMELYVSKPRSIPRRHTQPSIQDVDRFKEALVLAILFVRNLELFSMRPNGVDIHTAGTCIRVGA